MSNFDVLHVFITQISEYIVFLQFSVKKFLFRCYLSFFSYLKHKNKEFSLAAETCIPGDCSGKIVFLYVKKKRERKKKVSDSWSI